MYFFETDDGEINLLDLISLLHLKHLIFIQMALKPYDFSVGVCVYVCVCCRQREGRSGLKVGRRPAAQGDLITNICSACRCKSHSVSVKSQRTPRNHGGS